MHALKLCEHNPMQLTWLLYLKTLPGWEYNLDMLYKECKKAMCYVCTTGSKKCAASGSKPSQNINHANMNIAAAELWLSNKLADIYEPSEAIQMASMVMEKITGLYGGNRAFQRAKELNAEQEQQLKAYFIRLEQHEPVQYVLGEAWFYDFPLYVDGNVLIPRPETEELVEWVLKDVQASGKPVFQKTPTDADRTNLLKVLDVGTGSGCIALALKRKMPLAEVWGCDVSDGALNVARRNGSDLDIRVDFVGLDFLDEAQWRQLPTVDILVSNPPYIPLTEKDSMAAHVVNHEPHKALFVPDQDPLIFYKALANFGHHRLYPQGSIYLEIHENLGAAVCRLLDVAGYTTELRKDLQGRDRMIRASKKL